MSETSGDFIVNETYMREAIQLASSAKEHGNHPFGALFVVDDEIVIRAENSVLTKKNSSHHAESNLMNLISESSLTKDQIARGIVYTSTEPCAMCCGAIYWGGVRKIVYGCPTGVLADIAGDDFAIPCRSIFSVAKKTPVQVVGPVLEEEAVKVHIGFWDQEA